MARIGRFLRVVAAAVAFVFFENALVGVPASVGSQAHWLGGHGRHFVTPALAFLVALILGLVALGPDRIRRIIEAVRLPDHQPSSVPPAPALVPPPPVHATAPSPEVAPAPLPFGEWLVAQREQGRWIRDQLEPPKGYVVAPAAQLGGIFLAQLEQRTREWATTIRGRLRNEAPQYVGRFDEAGPDLPRPHMLAAVIGKAEMEDLIAFVDAKLAVLDEIIVAEQKGAGAAHRALLTWLGEKIEHFQGLRAALDEQVALPVPTMATTRRIETGFWQLNDEIATRLQLDAPEWADYYDEEPPWFYSGLTLLTSEQFGRLSRFIGWKADRLRHIKRQLS